MKYKFAHWPVHLLPSLSLQAVEKYRKPTETFIQTVENNPVLEGWNTKIVLIQSAE